MICSSISRLPRSKSGLKFWRLQPAGYRVCSPPQSRSTLSWDTIDQNVHEFGISHRAQLESWCNTCSELLKEPRLVSNRCLGPSPKQVDLPAPLGSTWKSCFHGSGWSNLPLGAPQTYPNCWAQKDCVRTQQDPLLFAENSRRIKFLTPVLCCSRSSSIFFAAR